jgi:hypothetical protein
MIPPQVTSFKYRHFAGGLRRLESSLWDNPLVLALPTMMSGPAPDEYACHFAHDYLLSGAIHNLAPSTDSRSGYKPVGFYKRGCQDKTLFLFRVEGIFF